MATFRICRNDKAVPKEEITGALKSGLQMRSTCPLAIRPPGRQITAYAHAWASGTDARLVLAAGRERLGGTGALHSPPGLPQAETLPKLADSCENPIAICVCLARGTKYSLIEKTGIITLGYDKIIKQSSELSQTEKANRSAVGIQASSLN